MGVMAPTSPRIASLDQFRGYTVLGMFFVNFLGGYAAIHAIFKHHNTYCSYADTIMPHFFFCVGFAYRLTFLRRQETQGTWAAVKKAIWRSLGLILIGFIIYGDTLGRAITWQGLQKLGLWGVLKQAFENPRVIQTLVHIALTSLWVLPVIGARPWIRVGYIAFSGALHVLLSWLFYYDWTAQPRGIDGGPLGFLTWTIPLLVGSLAYDAMQPAQLYVPAARPILPGGGELPATTMPMERKWSAVFKFLLWGAVLMAVGYGFSCLDFPTKDGQEKRTAELNELDEKIAALEKGADDLEKLPELTTQIEKLKEQKKRFEGSFHLVECPFTPPEKKPVDMWTINQRAGSISYLTFAAGLSLFLYAFFVMVCDVWQFPPGAPNPRSLARLLCLFVAWLLLLASSAVLLPFLLWVIGLWVLSIIAIFVPTEGAALPMTLADAINAMYDIGHSAFDLGTPYLSQIPEQFRPGSAEAFWTWGIIIVWLISLAGWELRRWANRRGSCTGSVLRTLGSNALAAYIIHGMVDTIVRRYSPGNSPLWYALLSFGVFLGICYVILRFLEKNKLFFRL